MDDAKARRALVVALRNDGLLFREIADRLAISSSRAAQLYHKGVEDEAAPKPVYEFTLETPIDNLPIDARSRAALLSYGVPLSDLIHRDRLILCTDMLRLPNCNRRAWNEIERILDACVDRQTDRPLARTLVQDRQ